MLLFSGILNPKPSYTPSIVLEGNSLAPNFILTNHKGEKFNLADVKDKVILIFFGYTNCPDVCPIVMSKYVELTKVLGEDAKKVALLFISTDPERDSPQAIKAFIERFDQNPSPSIIGLTGSFEELSKVWKAYNVPVEVEEHKEGENYLVGHYALIFVADKNHVLRFALTPEMSLEEYIQTVRLLL